MVDVSAAFPNTSRDEVKETLKYADPGVAKWVDTWLDNRQIAMELDGYSGPLRSAGSGLSKRSPLSPVLFGLMCGRILKELPDGRSHVDDCDGQSHSTALVRKMSLLRMFTNCSTRYKQSSVGTIWSLTKKRQSSQ
jgi:hypothetical protein